MPPFSGFPGSACVLHACRFGTFVPEDRQREYYGLAKQPLSFDPLHTNAEHWRRVHANIASRGGGGSGGGGGGSTLSAVCRFIAATLRRRVKHPWVFTPAALFTPLPQQGLWTLPAAAPSDADRVCPPGERRKYDGAAAGAAAGRAGAAYVGAHFLATLAFAFAGLMLPFGRLGAGDAAARSVAVALSLASLGRVSDGGAAGRVVESARVALGAAVLLVWRPARVAAVVAPELLAAGLVLAWGVTLAVGFPAAANVKGTVMGAPATSSAAVQTEEKKAA